MPYKTVHASADSLPLLLRQLVQWTSPDYTTTGKGNDIAVVAVIAPNRDSLAIFLKPTTYMTASVAFTTAGAAKQIIWSIYQAL